MRSKGGRGMFCDLKICLGPEHDTGARISQGEVRCVIAQVVGWAKPDPTTKQVLKLGNPTPNVTSM
jgi:hypothetical protein